MTWQQQMNLNNCRWGQGGNTGNGFQQQQWGGWYDYGGLGWEYVGSNQQWHGNGSGGNRSNWRNILEKKNWEIMKLRKENNDIKLDKKALEKKISELNEKLKERESELSQVAIKNNKVKIEKDFKAQIEKAWKDSYCNEIEKLKAELEIMAADYRNKEVKICDMKKLYECDMCGLIVKTAGLLRRHNRVAHRTNLFCDIKQEVEDDTS